MTPEFFRRRRRPSGAHASGGLRIPVPRQPEDAHFVSGSEPVIAEPEPMPWTQGWVPRYSPTPDVQPAYVDTSDGLALYQTVDARTEPEPLPAGGRCACHQPLVFGHDPHCELY